MTTTITPEMTDTSAEWKARAYELCALANVDPRKCIRIDIDDTGTASLYGWPQLPKITRDNRGRELLCEPVLIARVQITEATPQSGTPVPGTPTSHELVIEGGGVTTRITVDVHHAVEQLGTVIDAMHESSRGA